MSRDVFKNKNECQLISTYSSKRHLNATCLVVRFILISNVTIEVWADLREIGRGKLGVNTKRTYASLIYCYYMNVVDCISWSSTMSPSSKEKIRFNYENVLRLASGS